MALVLIIFLIAGDEDVIMWSGLIKSFSRGQNGVNISIKTVTFPRKRLCRKHYTHVESGEWAHRTPGWVALASLRLYGSYSMSMSRRWGFEYRRVDILIRQLQWHWAELRVGRWKAKKEKIGRANPVFSIWNSLSTQAATMSASWGLDVGSKYAASIQPNNVLIPLTFWI